VRAITYDRYGGIDVLRLGEVPEPQVRSGCAVVDVRAAALNPKDALFRRGRFARISGRRFPKFTGVDFAGVVHAAGEGSGVVAGQRVFGMIEEWRYVRGTLAERVLVRANEVAPLPDAVDFETGAALALTGATALQALRDVAEVGEGDRVAIHGASGGVGTIAIQVARVLGARVVTTSSAANLELCRRLGAEEALDYTTAPIEALRGLACIFDVFGNLRFERVRAALAQGGTYVTTVPSPGALAREAAARIVGGPRRLVVVRARRDDLDTLAGWAKTGRVRPEIALRASLDDLTPPFELLESKRARGKIVVTI
jgi:NADPH:quinone reductase-like Zn-dependent oxidoreductase